jgi:hypothetical protein
MPLVKQQGLPVYLPAGLPLSMTRQFFFKTNL